MEANKKESTTDMTGHYVSSLVVTVFISAFLLGLVALILEGIGLAIWGFVSVLGIGFFPAALGMAIFMHIKPRTKRARLIPTLLYQTFLLFTYLSFLLCVYAAYVAILDGFGNFFNSIWNFIYNNPDLFFYAALYAILIPITDFWVSKRGFRLHMLRFPKPPQSE